MSEKPEPSSVHSYPCHVLNVVGQCIQMTAGMWDTYSHSQKVEMLQLMVPLIVAAIEVQEAKQEQP